MKVINPDTIAKPASRYAQAVEHSAGARRIVISGQVGVTPDGRIEEGLEAQCERAWTNVFAILEAAGYARTDLVRVVMYTTARGQVGVCRSVRDRMLDGHLCASTYLEIAGLAAPAFVFELEAEAVKE
ncbi:MAG: RidA family protein [Hyphomicrobiaceae bacterium]|nr:RidA family protein [Hyphomicrobiaceae bacterium]